MVTSRQNTGASKTAKPVRADAHRNRERLLEVARRVFAADGKVTLDSIAREAGVGIGTLYRHFPTREALIEAVYRAEIRKLCDSAIELARTTRPADAALRAWMDRFADYIAAKREMADALRVAVASGAITREGVRAELSTAVADLLDAGAEDGTLRPDARAQDVVAALVGVFLACGPDQRAQADRLMCLLVDGLRPR
ncbi:TetR/AcrR family transcriptional regulator [Nocardia terpenica]|uniref:TetR family transcriptional regulator n=1 Tax=Nocardia terpenica TaxID=455432 RepID=A0A6G9YWQ4_9NOCA|nr:TetR/AcrR family transcriptional regulator [Nocardia terpenica]QIS17426.1 TetR family transcriptional regulator [Nocardia terpenica]